MRLQLDNFIEKIDEITTAAMEYETEHEDAGGNYLECCLADGMAHNNADERLADFMALHGIDGDAREALEYLASMDMVELESGSTFGCLNAFYSANEYHRDPPNRFVCDSYPVQEIETQIDLSQFDTPYAQAFARLAQDDNRVCINYREGDDNLLSYEATDAVWFALITLESLQEWKEDTV
jgi:hypothetical protein